jgi:hypothetical protein
MTETWFELRTYVYSDTMLNHQLPQKLKLIERDELINHLYSNMHVLHFFVGYKISSIIYGKTKKGTKKKKKNL